MRMLHSDTARELVFTGQVLVAPCDENAPDLDGCPQENLGLAPEVPFRSRYTTPFIPCGRTDLVVDETTENFSDEGDQDEDEDETPRDYSCNSSDDFDYLDDYNPFEREESAEKSVPTSPEIPVIVVIDPVTRTACARTDDPEENLWIAPDKYVSNLERVLSLIEEILMVDQCHGFHGDLPVNDDYGHFSDDLVDDSGFYGSYDDYDEESVDVDDPRESDPFGDEDECDYYVDKWTPAATPVLTSKGKKLRRDRIRELLWRLEDEADRDWMDRADQIDIQGRIERRSFGKSAARELSEISMNRRHRPRLDSKGRRHYGYKGSRAVGERYTQKIWYFDPGRDRFNERTEAEMLRRDKMVQDRIAGRQIFVDPHGWHYWCHPKIDILKLPSGITIEQVCHPRQGDKLTPDEFRFFQSLSLSEQCDCLHQKSREDFVVSFTKTDRGYRESRSNSWKNRRRQNRQWESPHMRQGHAPKEADWAYYMGDCTFQRVLNDRIRVLNARIETERASLECDLEKIRAWNVERIDIDQVLFWELDREGGRIAEEVFWRVRNHGTIPLDMQKKIAEEWSDSKLIQMLVAAGFSYDEAYRMQEDRFEMARDVAA